MSAATSSIWSRLTAALPFLSLGTALTALYFPHLVGFALIPILLGHWARHSTKDEGGRLFALWGLGFGYLALLGELDFLSSLASMDKARNITTLAAATSLELAILNFEVEYGHLPEFTGPVHTDSVQGLALLHVLLGTEAENSDHQNDRDLKFISVREGKNRKGGLIWENENTLIGLFDPWGSAYEIVMDDDGDGKISLNNGSGPDGILHSKVVARSPGKDGIFGTKDDIIAGNP